MKDHNTTQAAIRAGYSKKNAGQQGCRLYKNPEIKAQIDEAIEKQKERIQVSADEVLLEIKRVAFSEASDASTSEMRYSSKLKALEMLGNYLGMFDKRAKNDVQARENNLLEAIKESTSGKVETDDIPEIQQTSKLNDDVVESAGI